METLKAEFISRESDNEKKSLKICVLTLNRHDQLNAVNDVMLNEFRNFLQVLKREEHLKALIINSEITKAFCSGIDLKYVRGLSNEESADFFEELADLLEQINSLPFLTIASISGYAFGVGADIALACDLRVASPTALFRFPGAQFGLILGTQRLVQEIGPSKARAVALTSKRLDVHKAYDYGLIHEISEKDNHFNVAMDWANKIGCMQKYTLDTIKEVCTYNHLLDPFDAVNLAKKSVQIGDFSNRLLTYINKN